MCLVAIYFQEFIDAAVVVGANREELYARGGEPPQILPGRLRAVCGVDPVAGGTWLGVSEHGVLVAVTNRPKTLVPPCPPSRGLLARELLRFPTASRAAEHAFGRLRREDFAGCNVLCADIKDAIVIHAGDALERLSLSPGLHVLTASNVDDPLDARQEFARRWLGRRSPRGSEEAVAALQELCSLREQPPMCLRGPDGGTVSSSVIALRQPLGRSTYRHAQGPPDITPYLDYSSLLHRIAPSTKGEHAEYPHRIRLRGPWEWRPSESDSAAPNLVHMPCTWQDLVATQPGAQIRFLRRFGQPQLQNPNERVWLVVEGLASSAKVWMNDNVIDPCHTGPERCEREVTDLLERRNRLRIQMDRGPDGERPWQEIELEVRCAAYLRDVRIGFVKDGPESRVRVSGEVAGATEQPLELYVLVANRTVGYAAVKAGEPFAVSTEPLPADLAGAARIELVSGAVVWHALERPLPAAAELEVSNAR